MPDERSTKRPTLRERLADEFDRIFAHVERQQELVEPTEDEARNGWTAEALTQYLAERTTGQSIMCDPHSLQSRAAKRPRFANNCYDPFRMRRR